MATQLGPETGVLHVLDSKFLRPFKVLRFSLFEQQTLQNCPVIVISDDEAVVNDPFVNGVADSVEHVTREQIAVFSGIRGDRIAEKLATHFAPKYTFLKLLMFKDRGFRRHLFIDADMLCLRPIEDELMSSPFDAKAVREFGASVFPARRDPRPDDWPAATYRYIEEHSVPIQTPVTGINSGLVVLEGEGMGDYIFDAAIKAANADSFPSEQALTTAMISARGLSYLRLPIWYNARRRMFASLGDDFFDRVRDQIVLLHYTPGKPWKMSEAEIRIWDDSLDCEHRSHDWVAEVSSRR